MYRRRAAWSEIGSDAITVSLQVCSWSHDLIEKPAAFRDHAPAGTTAMTNTQSDERKKTDAVSRGGAVARIRPSVAWSCPGLWEKEGDALRRGNIHVQLSIDV
jgi:hypothetical protein